MKYKKYRATINSRRLRISCRKISKSYKSNIEKLFIASKKNIKVLRWLVLKSLKNSLCLKSIVKGNLIIFWTSSKIVQVCLLSGSLLTLNARILIAMTWKWDGLSIKDINNKISNCCSKNLFEETITSHILLK